MIAAVSPSSGCDKGAHQIYLQVHVYARKITPDGESLPSSIFFLYHNKTGSSTTLLRASHGTGAVLIRSLSLSVCLYMYIHTHIHLYMLVCACMCNLSGFQSVVSCSERSANCRTHLLSQKLRVEN